jgi:hypothetical protein
MLIAAMELKSNLGKHLELAVSEEALIISYARIRDGCWNEEWSVV